MTRSFVTPYNYRQRTATVGGGRGSRSVALNYYNEEEEEEDNTIRKGPWKAEEDEVLINHVNKYGPREWSSIRSKGLLRRTGKSCRLRWVNKLRPNLKNGCKFSVEEERLVIEMQAQIGNKWARIATYLPGRTDNDVKNFWSSRQKRLARMRQASSTSSSTTPPQPSDDPQQENNNNNNYPMISTFSNTEDHGLSDLEVPMVPDQYSFAMEEMIMIRDGDWQLGFKPDQCGNSLFSAYISHEPECMRMVEMPALLNDSNMQIGQETKMDMMMNTTLYENPNGIINEMEHSIPFPQNVLRTHQPEGHVINEELLVEPGFMDVFGNGQTNDQLDLFSGCVDGVFCSNTCEQKMIFVDQELTECGSGGLISCNIGHGNNVNLDDDLKNPDIFFDDFPCDVFDDQMEDIGGMESLPSTSKW